MPKMRLPVRKKSRGRADEAPPVEPPRSIEPPQVEAQRSLRRSKRLRQEESEEDIEVGLSRDGGNGGSATDEFGIAEAEEQEIVEEVDDELENVEDRHVSDDESGDDIWEEDKFPDPLSHSDDDGDEQCDGGDDPVEHEDPEDFLSLGKTFNSPEEFKLAVL